MTFRHRNCTAGPGWGDVFRVGLVAYTSQNLYGPDDEDGTQLLAPGQEPITGLGEVCAAVRGTYLNCAVRFRLDAGRARHCDA